MIQLKNSSFVQHLNLSGGVCIIPWGKCSYSGKCLIWSCQDLAVITGPTAYSCVALGKLLDLSEPQFGFSP